MMFNLFMLVASLFLSANDANAIVVKCNNVVWVSNVDDRRFEEVVAEGNIAAGTERDVITFGGETYMCFMNSKKERVLWLLGPVFKSLVSVGIGLSFVGFCVSHWIGLCRSFGGFNLKNIEEIILKNKDEVNVQLNKVSDAELVSAKCAEIKSVDVNEKSKPDIAKNDSVPPVCHQVNVQVSNAINPVTTPQSSSHNAPSVGSSTIPPSNSNRSASSVTQNGSNGITQPQQRSDSSNIGSTPLNIGTSTSSNEPVDADSFVANEIKKFVESKAFASILEKSGWNGFKKDYENCKGNVKLIIELFVKNKERINRAIELLENNTVLDEFSQLKKRFESVFGRFDVVVDYVKTVGGRCNKILNVVPNLSLCLGFLQLCMAYYCTSVNAAILGTCFMGVGVAGNYNKIASVAGNSVPLISSCFNGIWQYSGGMLLDYYNRLSNKRTLVPTTQPQPITVQPQPTPQNHDKIRNVVESVVSFTKAAGNRISSLASNVCFWKRAPL